MSPSDMPCFLPDFSIQTLKKTSKRLKNIEVCRFAIPEIWNIPENWHVLMSFVLTLVFLKKFMSNISSCNIYQKISL